MSAKRFDKDSLIWIVEADFFVELSPIFTLHAKATKPFDRSPGAKIQECIEGCNAPKFDVQVSNSLLYLLLYRLQFTGRNYTTVLYSHLLIIFDVQVSNIKKENTTTVLYSHLLVLYHSACSSQDTCIMILTTAVDTVFFCQYNDRYVAFASESSSPLILAFEST